MKTYIKHIKTYKHLYKYTKYLCILVALVSMVSLTSWVSLVALQFCSGVCNSRTPKAFLQHVLQILDRQSNCSCIFKRF